MDWCGGSRPCFWRWPRDFLTSSRDGHRIFIRDSLPTNLVPQTPTNKEFEVRVKIIERSLCQRLYNLRTRGEVFNQLLPGGCDMEEGE